MSTLLVALLALWLVSGVLFGLVLCRAAATGDAQMAADGHTAARHELEVVPALRRAERAVARGGCEHIARANTAPALVSLRHGDRSALGYLFARYADSSA
jgi:hypothetical protein